MIEVGKIREKVKQLVESAGPEPHLLAYDVNGIQDFVTASDRLPAMRAASKAIHDFDVGRQDKAVFAGGGRGVLVVPRGEWEEREQELHAEFLKKVNWTVATAVVPLQRGQEAASLAWLRAKLETAKDQAGPPPGELPTDKKNQCKDCRAYLGDRESKRKSEVDRVCERCANLYEAGRSDQNRGTSLVDIAEDGRIAAVSGDGNNLGRFFKKLDSIERLAVASAAVAAIFGQAHGEAIKPLKGEMVSLVTGGDDIRLFLAPSQVIAYMDMLAAGIREKAAEAARDAVSVLSSESTNDLAGLQVGVGVVVADDHYPASRLMEYAHLMERRAKKNRADDLSAVDFAVLVSGDELIEGDEALEHGAGDIRPVALDNGEWKTAVHRARALLELPTSQRAQVADAAPGPEFINQFRYQVARSKAWQKWFEDCGLDWKDRDAVANAIPKRGHLDLVRLLRSEKRS